MTAKEILQKVKAIFAEPIVPAPLVEPGEPIISAGVDCKLPDGRTMNCNPSPEIGALCTIDGQPAPDGEYQCTLPDGSVCVCVCQGGVCIDVKMPEPMTTEIPPQPTVEERLAKLEEAILKISQPVLPTGLATEVQLQEATARIEKQDKVIEGLFELAEKLSEEPTAEPTTLTGAKKEKFERLTKREERHAKIAEALKQNKALA